MKHIKHLRRPTIFGDFAFEVWAFTKEACLNFALHHEEPALASFSPHTREGKVKILTSGERAEVGIDLKLKPVVSR